MSFEDQNNLDKVENSPLEDKGKEILQNFTKIKNDSESIKNLVDGLKSSPDLKKYFDDEYKKIITKDKIEESDYDLLILAKGLSGAKIQKKSDLKDIKKQIEDEHNNFIVQKNKTDLQTAIAKGEKMVSGDTAEYSKQVKEKGFEYFLVASNGLTDFPKWLNSIDDKNYQNNIFGGMDQIIFSSRGTETERDQLLQNMIDSLIKRNNKDLIGQYIKKCENNINLLGLTMSKKIDNFRELEKTRASMNIDKSDILNKTFSPENITKALSGANKKETIKSLAESPKILSDLFKGIENICGPLPKTQEERTKFNKQNPIMGMFLGLLHVGANLMGYKNGITDLQGIGEKLETKNQKIFDYMVDEYNKTNPEDQKLLDLGPVESMDGTKLVIIKNKFDDIKGPTEQSEKFKKSMESYSGILDFGKSTMDLEKKKYSVFQNLKPRSMLAVFDAERTIKELNPKYIFNMIKDNEGFKKEDYFKDDGTFKDELFTPGPGKQFPLMNEILSSQIVQDHIKEKKVAPDKLAGEIFSFIIEPSDTVKTIAPSNSQEKTTNSTNVAVDSEKKKDESAKPKEVKEATVQISNSEDSEE